MNEQHKYRSTDKMSDLICDNYSLLMVMSRFGLSLGFGNKSVKDVCEAQGVDLPYIPRRSQLYQRRTILLQRQ